MLGNDITLCIAGNKIDMEKERHVSVEQAEEYVIHFVDKYLVLPEEQTILTLKIVPLDIAGWEEQCEQCVRRASLILNFLGILALKMDRVPEQQTLSSSGLSGSKFRCPKCVYVWCMQNKTEKVTRCGWHIQNQTVFVDLVQSFLLVSVSRYASSVGARHFHTSAKLNKGIEEMFLDLSKSKYHKAIGRAFL